MSVSGGFRLPNNTMEGNAILFVVLIPQTRTIHLNHFVVKNRSHENCLIIWITDHPELQGQFLKAVYLHCTAVGAEISETQSPELGQIKAKLSPWLDTTTRLCKAIGNQKHL